MKHVLSTSIEFVPASHEHAADPGVLKKILASHVDTLSGQIQMINWAKLLPYKSFTPHTHVDMTELYIMVEGSAIATVDKEVVHVHKGDLLIIHPKEEHSMKNESDMTVYFIAIGIA